MTKTNFNETPWWKTSVMYHIYIRSFCDGNGDGIGDLQGVLNKLDYLQEMGYGAIWISPFTESPQQDFGYDVSDYQSVSPLSGDMGLFEKLLEEVHKRGMKLILDLVLNHTSDQHSWFKESSSSRDNPKADWYVWKDGKGKNGMKRPNNWRAMSGNRAWNYHPVRKQFYYTGFLPFQPDLNYDNPEVKQAMFDMVRFWLKKGVDGFRLDIISAIYEDPQLRNNPFTFVPFPSDKSLSILFQHLKYNFLQERSFEFATELRKVVDEFPDKFIVGETHGEESLIRKFCKYQGKEGLHTIFLFKTITTPFKAKAYYKLVKTFEDNFSESLMPTYVFGNHDRTRMMKRLGGDIRKAKLLALFQLTVRGVPFIYYGEELGMTKVRIPLTQAQDPIGVRNKMIPQFIMDSITETLNRDECRTPMQWDGTKNAGFCPEEVKSWLPIHENHTSLNVQQSMQNENSQLNFYKKCIHLRNRTPALHNGNLTLKDDLCSGKILAFTRTHGQDSLLVLLNMSRSTVSISDLSGEMLLSTHTDIMQDKLQPWEGRILKVD